MQQESSVFGSTPHSASLCDRRHSRFWSKYYE